MSTHVYQDANGSYDVYTLWELTKGLPAFPVLLSHVESNLDLPCWDGPTPREVMNAMHEHQDHASRIWVAELQHPILLHSDGQTIIDGIHRLARAALERLPTIMAKIVPTEMMISALVEIS
jgi:hypothetical protein